ncbi:T9SS type A sorting domain-containing protein [Sphingobacteriales bacterium CHB3]|nr:T9SS type A sorting domain-containing protein [Sphingobacteriales bacterium CHB3]
MHKIQTACLLLLVGLLLYPLSAEGQNIVRVPPFSGTNYLNNIINGDTLANGTRRDPNAVYVLQRGGLYLSNAVIRNIGYTLRLQTHDTTAGISNPAVFLFPASAGGNPPGQFVDMRGDAIIKSLIISGYFEADPTELTKLQGALFNATAPGLNLTIDSCILTNTNGNHIRTDQAPRTIRVTNTIFGNMGYLGRSNLGAGKGLDVRGGSVDSLIIMNCTFVNWQDRVVRHFASTANINYMRFEHNTLVNGMSYHGLLSLGRVGRRIIIRDNLLIDPFGAGQDTDAVRQAEFTDSGELDAFGFPRMTWIFSNPNDSTSWLIKNNYYRVTPVGQSFYDSASILPIVANPPLTVGSPLSYHINSKIGADSATAFRTTDVSLANVPRQMDALMKWYRRPTAMGGANKTKATGNWAAAYDYDRRSYQYWRDTLNASYSTSHAMYTAGTCGYPVGSLMWFPTRYAAWLTDPCVNTTLPVKDGDPGVPTAFELEQNYPNPFNPSTKIAFSLTGSGFTTLTVYNVLGQKVASPMAQNMEAGRHEVDFNSSDLTSGVYFYRLESGNYSAVRKMMILK